MTHITCGIEGCPCGDSSPGNPSRGACGKASAPRSDPWSDGVGLERIHDGYSTPPSAPRPDNMGFGALTVEEGARPGWLARQLDAAERETAKWPAWKREAMLREAEGARPANAEAVSEAAAAKADCGCGNTMRALKGRVRALMEENVRLEDAKAALESRIDELEQDPVSRTPFIDAAADRVAVLELRAERALNILISPWCRPDRVRAILRGDA